MAISDHAISTRAISAPEELVVPPGIDVFGTVIIADSPAALLDVEDSPGAWCKAADSVATLLELADTVSGQVIIADGATPLELENLP